IGEPGAVEPSGVRDNAREVAEVHGHRRVLQCHAPLVAVARKQPELGSHCHPCFLVRRCRRTLRPIAAAGAAWAAQGSDIKIGIRVWATPSNLPTCTAVATRWA